MEKILVTGGSGYIGSHTIIDLIDYGFEVISVDNFSRSSEKQLQRICDVTGKQVTNYATDICDKEAIKKVFEIHTDIKGVIHFAAYKSVPESVENPLLYFENNINSLLNILACLDKFNISHFVFSSSCSVYGNIDSLPVTEDTALKEAASPYARTKQIGEQIIRDFARANKIKNILLRYFNPVGAHSSGIIGETPGDTPENLFPIITETAIGKRQSFNVFGDDYNTRDGTCIRDYIHVMDIAHAHTMALQHLIANKQSSNYEIFNLGSGQGVSVLEAINAFEEVSGQKLNYKITPRRAGDVEAIYANNDKAQHVLKWSSKSSLKEMMSSAWKWQQYLSKEE